jgi:hypothetical protein
LREAAHPGLDHAKVPRPGAELEAWLDLVHRRYSLRRSDYKADGGTVMSRRG